MRIDYDDEPMKLIPLPPAGTNVDQVQLITTINNLIVKLLALQDRQVILANYIHQHHQCPVRVKELGDDADAKLDDKDCLDW